MDFESGRDREGDQSFAIELNQVRIRLPIGFEKRSPMREFPVDRPKVKDCGEQFLMLERMKKDAHDKMLFLSCFLGQK